MSSLVTSKKCKLAPSNLAHPVVWLILDNVCDKLNCLSVNVVLYRIVIVAEMTHLTEKWMSE